MSNIFLPTTRSGLYAQFRAQAHFQMSRIVLLFILSLTILKVNAQTDNTPPQLICLSGGIFVNIMNSAPPGITLWASDFIQYVADDQTPFGQIQTAARIAGTGSGFPADQSGNPISSVEFNCGSIGQQTIEIWARDLAGNTAICISYAFITDNSGSCNPATTYCFQFLTEGGNGIQNVGDNTTSNLSTPSGVLCFALPGQPGSNATITPFLEDDPANGVSVWDIVLIYRHILGIDGIGSPYKLIAADANKSGTVTSTDILEIKKLILGIYETFPTNSSWRFVDASQIFSAPGNPFADVIKENLGISPNTPLANNTFKGIKIGDINLSAVANELVQPETPTDTTYLLFPQGQVNAGDIIEIPFFTGETQEAWQLTLNFHKNLELLEIVPGATSGLENFGVFSNNDPVFTGKITSVGFFGEETFSLKFKVLQSGQLEDYFQMGADPTPSWAYDQSGHLSQIALKPDGQVSSPDVLTSIPTVSATPNPWRQEVFITAQVKENTPATLQIFSPTGALVYEEFRELISGKNTFSFTGKQAGDCKGFYFYQLITPNGIANGKMIRN